MAHFTTFIFCRHGESELNAKNHKEETDEANSPLNLVGIVQSEILAKKLILLIQQQKYQDHKINVLISNLDRATDTAKPFLKLLEENGIPFEKTYRNDIIEYLGPHKILKEDLQSKGIKLDKNWQSFIDQRVFPFFEQLKIYAPGTVNIVFSHGYFIAALLAIIAVQGEYHGYQRVAFELDNCSKTIVTFNHNTKWFSIHFG